MRFDIFLLSVAALAAVSQVANADNCWRVYDNHTIEWNASQPSLPYNDHIEMSGEKVSAVIRYGVDRDGRLSLGRSVVFPMLRTIPNNTHASLTEWFDNDFTSLVNVDGRPTADGKVSGMRIDGTLTISEQFPSGIEISRCIFPSTTRAMLCERYEITNRAMRPVEVKVAPAQWTRRTEADKGVDGSYTLTASTAHCDTLSRMLSPGETMSFAATISGRKFPEMPELVDVSAELACRRAFVDEMASKLVFSCPDPTLNTMFTFAKIRGAESIYRTKGGLMQSPGGEAYYAAIWANDQAEYINPFFPFLGYAKGNESAFNSFMHFSRFINPEYDCIPSSIVAEGLDYWNGVGDRGDCAMIAYGVGRYALASGSRDVAFRVLPLLEFCLEYCHRKLNSRGVVASDCDELETRFHSGDANLCTSSLYYDALVSADMLMRALGLPAKDYAARARSLREAIAEYFEANVEGFATYRYYDGNNILRSWICMPLTVDIFDRKEGTVAALFSPWLWTENGLLTQADDNTFWDRSTLYALRGIFASGERDKALRHLSSYSAKRLLGDHVPYPVEAWPEGGQRHLSTESALYCRIFTEGMLGFRPTGFRSFDLRPQLPDGWDSMELNNVYACSDTPYDIKVSRAGEKLAVEIVREGTPVMRYDVDNGTAFNVSFIEKH